MWVARKRDPKNSPAFTETRTLCRASFSHRRGIITLVSPLSTTPNVIVPRDTTFASVDAGEICGSRFRATHKFRTPGPYINNRTLHILMSGGIKICGSRGSAVHKFPPKASRREPHFTPLWGARFLSDAGASDKNPPEKAGQVSVRFCNHAYM